MIRLIRFEMGGVVLWLQIFPGEVPDDALWRQDKKCAAILAEQRPDLMHMLCIICSRPRYVCQVDHQTCDARGMRSPPNMDPRL